MALTFYYGSGSPYAWRVWLALELKRIAYTQKTMSFDAGDLETPQFTALNPRRKVPVIVDDGFALGESAAIVEYIEEKWPGEPRLFSADLGQRAQQRRMIREADAYVVAILERLVQAVLLTPRERWSQDEIGARLADLRQELAAWEELASWEAGVAGDYLAGPLSAVDFTLFPLLALILRITGRLPGFAREQILGPRMGAWMARMEALPSTRSTWPPHWR
ncbi:glutathione S-transferase [Rhizobiales bacterium GAS188]|nr:glutathione S-transferase [Rhizobiales bacterium GAS188]